MIDLLKAEFYKLFHARDLAAAALCTLLLASLMLLDSTRETAGLFYASLYNTPLLYFFVILFAARFVGAEFGGRTLASLVSAGHGRGSILLAKTVVYQAGCLSILGVPLLLHGLLGQFFQAGAPYGAASPAEIFVLLFAILAMGMLPLFCAFAFQDAGKAMAIPMVFYFLMIFAMNGSRATQFAALLPMGQPRLLALHALPLPAAAIAGIDLGWIALLYGGAYLCFCRADLK